MITYRNLGRYGRLGNQLFQLASTIGLAITHGEECMFPADWIYRPYFSIPDFMFGEIPEDAVEAHDKYAVHLDYRARPYLQDIDLFWKHIAVIRHFLRPSQLALDTLDDIKLPNAPRLGVHVRRGDNVIDLGVSNKSDYHLCPSLDYYLRGMSHTTSTQCYLAGMRRPAAIVLSDDIPWCRENIPADFYGDGMAYPKENEPAFGIEVPRDWIDLFTLASCQRLVISGSTFGIWGAILSCSNNVVRPDRVYGPIVAAYTDSELIFPKEWKSIPCS